MADNMVNLENVNKKVGDQGVQVVVGSGGGKENMQWGLYLRQKPDQKEHFTSDLNQKAKEHFFKSLLKHAAKFERFPNTMGRW